MIIKNQQDITTAVLAELERAPNKRFRETMTAAVRHMHEFVREVEADLREVAADHAVVRMVVNLDHDSCAGRHAV